MATLVPAILTRDPGEVHEKIKYLEQFPKITDVQIDFADGKFVPSELAYPKDIGRIETKLALEAHLMVQKPQEYLHDLEEMGAKSVFLHYESFHSRHEIETALRNVKFMDFKCGIALNPETEIDAVTPFLEHLDAVLVLGVYPGFQGSEFLEKTYQRIKNLRNTAKGVILEVDGGVKLRNAKRLISSGADRIVVGSGIWLERDVKQTIEKFLKLINA